MRTLFINNVEFSHLNDNSVYIGGNRKEEQNIKTIISLCNFDVDDSDWEICLRNITKEDFNLLIDLYKNITDDKRPRKTKKAGTKGNKISI